MNENMKHNHCHLMIAREVVVTQYVCAFDDVLAPSTLWNTYECDLVFIILFNRIRKHNFITYISKRGERLGN